MANGTTSGPGRRRAYLAAAAAVATGLAGPAAAFPDVDKVSAAHAEFRFEDDSSTVVIGFHAQVSDAGTSSGRTAATVTVQRCVRGRCDRAARYRARSASFVAAADQTHAQVRLTLFGRPTVVEWSAAGETAVTGQADMHQPVLPNGQLRAWVRREAAASASLTIGARRCVHRGVVYTEALVDGVAPEPLPDVPTALPRGTAAVLLHGRCP